MSYLKIISLGLIGNFLFPTFAQALPIDMVEKYLRNIGFEACEESNEHIVFYSGKTSLTVPFVDGNHDDSHSVKVKPFMGSERKTSLQEFLKSSEPLGPEEGLLLKCPAK